ncbi:hypothetical protein CAPTEDRAFT_201224, partial [Capitella teleta]
MAVGSANASDAPTSLSEDAVPLLKAVEIARNHTGAEPLEAEREVEMGQAMYEIKLADKNGEEIKTIIDAQTGEVILSNHRSGHDNDHDDQLENALWLSGISNGKYLSLKEAVQQSESEFGGKLDYLISYSDKFFTEDGSNENNNKIWIWENHSMSKRYNKPIPFGWYAVEYSEGLKTGEVKPVKYFGKELVLFRTESGQASLLDAYCPHLGAHLGHGGIVKGESVSCPFHAWKFDGTGMLTDIPYAKRIPPKVKDKPCIRSYPVVERNQMIWAWYHPNESVAPMWEVDTIEEVGAEGWTEFQTFDWNIKSIIQETGENAADIAHFVTVHNVPFMPESEVEMKGHRRSTIFDAQTHAVEEDGSVNHTGDNLEAARLESYNVGPGQTYQKFMRLFEVVLMAT